jgi:hypothetical protein
MIIQLDPSIPMYVEGRGVGEAFLLIDYSKEDELMFVVALDATGEIWCAPSPKCKLLNNWSLGRTYEVKK